MTEAIEKLNRAVNKRYWQVNVVEVKNRKQFLDRFQEKYNIDINSAIGIEPSLHVVCFFSKGILAFVDRDRIT